MYIWYIYMQYVLPLWERKKTQFQYIIYISSLLLLLFQFWFFVTFWFLIFVFEMQDVRKFAIATNCTTFRYIYIYRCMCVYICGCIHVCVCVGVYIWVEFIYNLCKFSLKIKFSLSKYAKRIYIENNGKYASRRYDSRLVDTSYASVNSIVYCNYPMRTGYVK